MSNFFKEKIDKKICQKSTFTNLYSDNLEFFYCSKILNISEFQNIYLTILGTELKIELTYKDLFYEYGDNYYFLIYFPDKYYSQSNCFKLGKMLFKKNILTFNHYTQMIGYYKANNIINKIDNKKDETEDEEQKEEKTNNKNKNSFKKYIPWSIIVVLFIIVLILGIYKFYYKRLKNRTRRINELKDDNYIYEEGINSKIWNKLLF